LSTFDYITRDAIGSILRLKADVIFSNPEKVIKEGEEKEGRALSNKVICGQITHDMF
jgi:hypothetical protein